MRFILRLILVIGLVHGAVPSTNAAPGHEGAEPARVAAREGTTMSFANENLMDVVVDPSSVVLVARIDAVETQPHADPETLEGTLRIAVLRELTPQRWHGPTVVALAFAQQARPAMRLRSGKLGFDGVDLDVGRYLIVGLEESPPTIAPISARTVAPLEGADGALARGIAAALAIEAEPPGASRIALVETALRSDLPFLPEYAHYAVGRLARIPRDRAVELEITLLRDERAPARDRAMSQATLELELWRADAPEDRENARILESFFATLGTADRELRRQLVESLHVLLAVDGDPSSDEAKNAARVMKHVALPSEHSSRTWIQAIADDPATAEYATWLTQLTTGPGRR